MQRTKSSSETKSSQVQILRNTIHQAKHSARSSNLFFRIFYCGGGGILSHHNIYLLQCISLHQRFIQIKFCIFFPGGFCPDNNFTFFSCGPIRFTLNTEQIMFWEGFVPGKILSQVGFSPLIYHSITINIHQDQVLYFSSFFVVGGFCPNNNYTVFYVHHQGKQSYRSSFVFFAFFCPGGDFVPTLILSSLYVFYYGKHS